MKQQARMLSAETFKDALTPVLFGADGLNV